MITLAFDTCLDKMYVVLKKDGEILESKIIENHDNKYHSAFLISTLQEVMCENSIKPNDIDLIGVNIGPGSFTGIRACVTVARVMAQQLNCKAVGVSSLEILANAGLHPNYNSKAVKLMAGCQEGKPVCEVSPRPLRERVEFLNEHSEFRNSGEGLPEEQKPGEEDGKLINVISLRENIHEQQTDKNHSIIQPFNHSTDKNCHPYLHTSLVALDARKNCAYLYHDGEIKGAVDLEKVKEIISSENYNVITDDKLQPILGGKSYQQENLPLGKILAELAEEKAKTNNCDWRKLKPLYIQPPPMG